MYLLRKNANNLHIFDISHIRNTDDDNGNNGNDYDNDNDNDKVKLTGLDRLYSSLKSLKLKKQNIYSIKTFISQKEYDTQSLIYDIKD